MASRLPLVATIFVVSVIGIFIAYNFRDMVVNWFIGVMLKNNKKYNELDYFEIDGGKCLLTKIGAFRCVFLPVDKDNKLTGKVVTIGNKQFIAKTITKFI